MTGIRYLPVGHKSVLLAPEHDAHVGGVVDRRIEVGVVADVGRDVHRCFVLLDEGSGKCSISNSLLGCRRYFK